MRIAGPVLVLSLCLGAPVPDVPLEEGLRRAAALEEAVRRNEAPDEELLRHLAAVLEAYESRVRGPGGTEPPAPATEGERKGRDRLARECEEGFLRALLLKRVRPKSLVNERHAVQVAAARALGGARPAIAPLLRRALKEGVFEDRDYEPLPPLLDAAFGALLRLDAPGSVEWLLEECVNADSRPATTARNVAALDAIRSWRGAPGPLRQPVLRRIVNLFQACDAFWNNHYEEVAGFRGAGKDKYLYAQYWIDVRDSVMETLRALATDPVTGAAALDVDDGTEIHLVRRYLAWMARHRDLRRPPWLDAPSPETPPRRRSDPVYVRPGVSPPERRFGIPWERWWTHRGRLPAPAAGLPDSPAPAPAAVREALRAKTLPPVLREWLVDREPWLRGAAAVLMGRLGAEGAKDLLLARLDGDADETVREAAMLGLLHLRDPTLSAGLHLRAEDAAENPRVRSLAVLALGLLGEGEALRARFLEKPPEEDLREPAVLRDLQACAARALALGPKPAEGAPALLASLLGERRRPPEVRGAAGTALLRLRDAAALPAVRRVLAERGDEGDAEVARVAAAIAWAGCGGPEDREGLQAAARVLEEMDGRFGGVRIALVDGLGAAPGAVPAKLLLEEYRRCRSDTRRFAERGWFLVALGVRRADEGRALLREELKELDHERDLAACALGLALAGDAASAPAIRARLESAEREFVPWGVLALGLLGDRDSLPLLRKLIERRREGAVIGHGARALALLLGEPALPELLDLWRRCRGNDQRDALADAFRAAAGPKTVEALLGIAGDRLRPPEERAFAMLALARIADPADPPLLDEFRRDVVPYSCAPTLDGLSRHGDFEPMRRLER